MKTMIMVCCLFICNTMVNLHAEQSESNNNQTTIKGSTATDNIFNDIMQSLPENVKNKLDSLKSNPEDNKLSVPDKLTTNRMDDQRRSELSQDLQLKVEKAMKQIDLQQQKRQLQFKESKKRK